MTNNPRSFLNTENRSTGLSDCHKSVLPLFEITFFKTGPKEMICIGISKKYFDILDVNKITDNKTFRINMQPLFPEKRKFANKITLEVSEKSIVFDDTLVSEELKLIKKCNKTSKYQ